MDRPQDSLFDRWLQERTQICYEDERVVVFVANIVRCPGQLLVVPKFNADYMNQLPPDIFSYLWQTVYRAANICRKVVGCEGIMIAQNDLMWKAQPDNKFHVKQVHVHIIPQTDRTDFTDRHNVSEDVVKNFVARYASYFDKLK